MSDHRALAPLPDLDALLAALDDDLRDLAQAGTDVHLLQRASALEAMFREFMRVRARQMRAHGTDKLDARVLAEDEAAQLREALHLGFAVKQRKEQEG